MWEMMEICASVALVGEFFTRMLRLPLSHALRTTGDNVFPSRLRTFRTDANSLSRIRSRLSLIPVSVPSTLRNDALLPALFDLESFNGSRTAQIKPSPLDNPDLMW